MTRILAWGCLSLAASCAAGTPTLSAERAPRGHDTSRLADDARKAAASADSNADCTFEDDTSVRWHAGPNVLPEGPVRQIRRALRRLSCRCAAPGDHFRLAFLVVPAEGRISLTSPQDIEEFPVDGTSPSDPESVATCFERGLVTPVFEPFSLLSDCIQCGITGEGRFVLPLLVDRRSEHDRTTDTGRATIAGQ